MHILIASSLWDELIPMYFHRKNYRFLALTSWSVVRTQHASCVLCHVTQAILSHIAELLARQF